MSEPRKLNNHATSSSIVTTKALAFFFPSSSRTRAILSTCDCPRCRDQKQSNKKKKKKKRVDLYQHIFRRDGKRKMQAVQVGPGSAK
jgi:hypothetical protein